MMNNDHKIQKYSVSVKGIISYNGRYLLRKNERNEWELLGGKLELGEEPIACLTREVEEEAGLQVRVGSLIDAWVYHIAQGVDVLILTYECFTENELGPLKSAEHAPIQFFSLSEIDSLNMPEGYKKSIRRVAHNL